MELTLQILLAGVLVLVAHLAIRAHRRVETAKCSRMLQRASIAVCASVMADTQNSYRLRHFAGTLSVIAMSEEALWIYGTKPRLRQLILDNAKNKGDAVDESDLTEAELTIIRPALEAFSMACLLNDGRYRRAIMSLWEAEVSHAFAKANTRADEKKAATEPAPKPADPTVTSRIEKVEQLVMRRVQDELCMA